MAKFFRTQLRLPSTFVKRLDKLQERSGVDRSNHIRIAISRYLEEEEMRHSLSKKMLTETAQQTHMIDSLSESEGTRLPTRKAARRIDPSSS